MQRDIKIIEDVNGYEAIYIDGFLQNEGNPLNEGIERVLWFIHIADAYGVDIKDIKFYLKFNNVESLFIADRFLEIETNRFYKVAFGPEGSRTYYTNKGDSLNIQQIDAYGELFLVDYPRNVWKLLNETKKIGNYTCYKATTIKKTKGRKGLIETPVEVWYTPEISIPFGPLGYNGLPGLIVELSMLNFKYYVSSIELNSENEMIIKKPSQGKKITKEQFEEIGIGAMDNFKKSFK